MKKIVCIAAMLFLVITSSALSAMPNLDFTPEIQGDYLVQVEIDSDFPDGTFLSVNLTKHGLSENAHFIGIDFIKVSVNGNKAIAIINVEEKAFPSVAAITKGKYDIEVSFYPRWKENKEISNRLGITDPIVIIKTIYLAGNGKDDNAFVEYKQDHEGRAWVKGEVFQGMKWNAKFWQDKFGTPEVYSPTSGNPNVLQLYYFKKLDMTILVNTLKKEIVTWREGKARQ